MTLLEQYMADYQRVCREKLALKEQFEALKKAAQEIETLAFRQYVDWMHFHELAMAKPFEAESEAQHFAQSVLHLLTEVLADDSTIEVIDGSNPASGPLGRDGQIRMMVDGEMRWVDPPASVPENEA